ALDRFRRFSLRLCGLRPVAMSASQLATVIRKRFPKTDPSLDTDLIACEEATWSETIEPRQALKLIQKLHMHQEMLTAAAKPDNQVTRTEDDRSKPQERAS
ncbi:MAG: hypothetical protein WB608_02525, partial [Terracidiphilus sp.]